MASPALLAQPAASGAAASAPAGAASAPEGAESARAGASVSTGAVLPSGNAVCTPLVPRVRQRGGARTTEAEPVTGPLELMARQIDSQLDQQTQASGEVALRRGGLSLTADSLRYLHEPQLVYARGRVQVLYGADSFLGTEAELNLHDQSGTVREPQFSIGRTGTRGQASRIDFQGSQQLRAERARYTSCPPTEAGQSPDWELTMDRLELDFEHNEGLAKGAVLRFLGTPILALPVLSFPATSAPKSGWLPPTIEFDTAAGMVVTTPYYWRIASNFDAIVAPVVSTRRGLGAKGDYRYLLPQDAGHLNYHLLPSDQVAGRSRYSLALEHEGQWADGQGRYALSAQQASDDAYWKDFSRYLPSLTPRLLPHDARATRQWTLPALGEGAGLELGARVQSWQVLQDSTALITPPYQRVPQLSLKLRGLQWGGLHYELETEASHFELGPLSGSLTPSMTQPQRGQRVYAQQALSWPVDTGWGWFTPRVSLNSASYRYSYTKLSENTTSTLDDAYALNEQVDLQATRHIPSFSLDTGLRFEREVSPFGKALVQTLEPRLHYVNTPWRDQTFLPLFDTAGSDFNAVSIYADNAFTGVDRISDAHQITLGATSRLLDRDNGVEHLRFGGAQRFLFRPQQLTADGTASVASSSGSSRFSDVLLFGSGRLDSRWHLDSTTQYDLEQRRPVRTIAALRYQPGPFQTLAATYRYTRGLSEQVDLGWQLPLYQREQRGSSGCQGVFYGVGRVSYSLRDTRVTDTLAGVEYDAGCWIFRTVAERTSTSPTQATTRLMLQLELVGLSRIGTNPLQTLKDNIPGYRLLREDD